MSVAFSWRRLSAGIAVLLAAAGAALAADTSATGSSAPAERRFAFTYTATVKDVPAGAQAASIWLPLPYEGSGQKARLRQVGAPVEGKETLESKYGNRMLHFQVPNPPAQFEIRLDFEVTRREDWGPRFRGLGNEALSDAEKAKLAPYLQANALVPVTGKAADLAKQVVGDEKNVVNAARRIYDYVLGEMRYGKDGQGWGTGSFEWACSSKYGNCTDFHALFISLARASGIPARFQIGFPIPPARGEGTVGGYHCWAEFYVPSHGWVPVDISEADKYPELAQYYFGNLTEDRVGFTFERDLVLSPPQKGGPLNYFVYPYVEVDGKPHAAIEKKFSYADAKQP
jgi:transglutaminase-like putative cysteine protease